MKKFFFVIALFLVGCTPAGDEISYTRSTNETKLKITQRANSGASISVELTNAKEAREYRERLQRLIKEIEDYEKELSIREKQ